VKSIEYFAIGFTMAFVIAVYIFAFWPRKETEEINIQHEEDEA